MRDHGDGVAARPEAVPHQGANQPHADPEPRGPEANIDS